jgi:hypothetical protein
MVSRPMPTSTTFRAVEGEVEPQVEGCQGEVREVRLWSESKSPCETSSALNSSSEPVARANGRVSATASPLIPTGPKANRPLDPALDPDREYAYKSKRGGKTFTMSYIGGPPVRVGPTLGRRKTPNDARATLVGSTVRIGPGPESKPKSEHSEPCRLPPV